MKCNKQQVLQQYSVFIIKGNNYVVFLTGSELDPLLEAQQAWNVSKHMSTVN